MTDRAASRLKPEVRGWLRHLWRKAMTRDDWSRGGEPHPWWDRYSLKPMLSFPRFDLSESSYAFLLLARKTPAWREVYTQILDELLRRHTTFWAAVDWLTQIGPDPDRARYPKAYKRLIPKDLWGQYDAPGWTANGVDPWGLQPDPIGASGNLFFRGFFNLMLAIHREVSGEATWDRPFEGDWWRAFNELDREKFTAPTVTDSEYPRLGFSVAWNDTERGVLELESYAATSSARGEATRFSVRNLPNAAAVRVSRDGRDHGGWRATGADSIEIETTIGSHRYEIFTGYRGSEAARAGRLPLPAWPFAHARARSSSRPRLRL